MMNKIKGKAGIRKPTGESSTRFITRRQSKIISRGGAMKTKRPLVKGTGQFM